MGSARAGSSPADVVYKSNINNHSLKIMHPNLKLGLKKHCVVVLYGSVPELGQRGATQDRMLDASWVQIPLLPPFPI